MGGPIRQIGRAIKKVVKKVTGFVGDFFGFNIKPMGAPDVGGGAEAEQGVLVSKTGTIEGIPVIYGYRRVGGTLVFVETSGTNNANGGLPMADFVLGLPATFNQAGSQRNECRLVVRDNDRSRRCHDTRQHFLGGPPLVADRRH